MPPSVGKDARVSTGAEGPGEDDDQEELVTVEVPVEPAKP